MDTRCVNCGGPGAERVTLTLGSETTISGVRVYEACRGVFRMTEWIRVGESPAAG